MDPDHWNQFLRGVELFNQGDFYQCHDTIEEIWLQESSDEQPFLQGIIQSAVGYHHYEMGKHGAARAMFGLAIQKLEAYPGIYHGVELAPFLMAIREWKRSLDEGISSGTREPVGRPYPKLEVAPQV